MDIRTIAEPYPSRRAGKRMGNNYNHSACGIVESELDYQIGAWAVEGAYKAYGAGL